jgi:hypothetical protein
MFTEVALEAHPTINTLRIKLTLILQEARDEYQD